MVDLDARTERLDEYMESEALEAVWVARPNGFAWLTGGSNVVDRTSPAGVAAAGYDGDLRVVTDSIEAGRLRDEEVPDAFDVEAFPWYESALADAVAARSPTPAAADFDVPGFAPLDAAAVRQPLTEADVDGYRALGRDAAAAVESVCREVAPDDTEAEVATALATALGRRGIESPVVLVGGSRRAQDYRHYTPRDDSLDEYALCSVTAERGGRFASLTRTVAFDAPGWLAERTRAAARVEATALAATRAVARGSYPPTSGGAGTAGVDDVGTAGDVFAAIQDAYAAVGFEGEWEHHHQGGAAGYAGREWIATPDATAPVRVPMAYAWNPTVQGAKSEDTWLVTEDGLACLTATGEWPTVSVASVDLEGVEGIEVDRHGVV